ncbi:hypothetical protein BH24ACT5_BH24ACT5_28170 [soil metagenome]
MTAPDQNAAPSWVVDRRTQAVAFGTAVAGAVLLAFTINHGDNTVRFVVTGAALAAVWVTGFVLVRDWRRHFQTSWSLDTAWGLAVGLAAFLVFVAGAWVVRRVGVLEGAVDDIFAQADAQPRGWVIAVAVVNGVAEELFFRGALMDAITPRRAVAVSTLIYVAVTAAGGNVALTLGAAFMGVVWAVARQRTASLVTPIVIHLTWSVLMITALPRS